MEGDEGIGFGRVVSSRRSEDGLADELGLQVAISRWDPVDGAGSDGYLSLGALTTIDELFSAATASTTAHEPIHSHSLTQLVWHRIV